MILAVDFDGVLNSRKGKFFGKPAAGTEAALEAITHEGIEIVVFTVVASTNKGRAAVIDWLEKYDLPYNDVTATKPNADAFIDDRGLHHTSWPATIKELNHRLRIDIEL